MPTIFFQSWDHVIRVAITIVVVYPGLILLMRLYGKRSLAKLNMFDFIITVALGSTFASVVVSKDVTVMDGIVAFGLLLTAQYSITFTSLRFEPFEKLIKSDPTLVFANGDFLEDDMKAVRVSKPEITSAIRKQGIACMDDVYAVVLETNGELSVINRADTVTRPTIEEIPNYDADVFNNINR